MDQLCWRTKSLACQEETREKHPQSHFYRSVRAYCRHRFFPDKSRRNRLEKNDFTKDWKDYEWTFSTSILKAGENTIIFTYTSGAHKLCLKDVVIKADGNAIEFYPEMRSAGSNPTEIFYAISVPKGTKKLEMSALARNKAGTGIISVTAE